MSEPSNRPSWDEYFMMMARDVVAQRATCNRRKVGAVIVRNKRILTTGYNGSPPGMPHCTDVGCWEVEGHCIRTIHAEQNAIAQAALHGVSTDGSTIYITAAPCVNCAKLLIAAGISRVVYADEYTDSLGQRVLEEKGIQCEQYTGR
ncbi:deoxycytidylate deaminase [Alicyclobacillus fastidiosus]|uniref:dCMP deaminase family protein n=1 Tax=Alicyclobacillus fastidiosus TaxID=392011 RepID=A0ABV5AEI0_9BACL|nr:dCMP deaminase family protein [Alicyclobacillus fastidiosus]WEH09945.1 dCMP deaminase family protein [Alicyclobacillus fastidiosus]